MFLALCVIYFAMNYLLIGSVFLSIGAQASTAREVQILSMPATIAQVLIFGFAALAVGSPDSDVAMAGAAFPLSSPLVMVARAAELPELWPHLLAIAWQALLGRADRRRRCAAVPPHRPQVGPGAPPLVEAC
jgi:ABC-2 type transport system permease protein